MLKSALATVGMVKPSPSRGQKKKCREMRRNKKLNRRDAVKERKVIRDAKRSGEQEIQRQDGKRGDENETEGMPGVYENRRRKGNR